MAWGLRASKLQGPEAPGAMTVPKLLDGMGLLGGHGSLGYPGGKGALIAIRAQMFSVLVGARHNSHDSPEALVGCGVWL